MIQLYAILGVQESSNCYVYVTVRNTFKIIC